MKKEQLPEPKFQVGDNCFIAFEKDGKYHIQKRAIRWRNIQDSCSKMDKGSTGWNITDQTDFTRIIEYKLFGSDDTYKPSQLFHNKEDAEKWLQNTFFKAAFEVC